MNNSIKQVIIVGGGIAGMSCAISLRKLGIAVSIIERDALWRIYGAGITVTGPTLRAFRTLGILDDVRREAAVWDRLQLYTLTGDPIDDLRFPELEAGMPADGAVLRPVLHGILAQRTRESGVAVRLGLSVSEFHPSDSGVSLTLSNGERLAADLLIGADGIYSATRQWLFPNAPKPRFTGQACWRLLAERPADMSGAKMYLGAGAKLGFSPVSRTHMYMYLLEHVQGDPWVSTELQASKLHQLMAGWGGMVPAVRAQLMSLNSIIYRPLEAILLPPPWHRGRAVLIGDAAHATTPHLASGAGLAVEDGLVLAEEIGRGGEFESLLQRFTARRFERCRLVVENSLRLGEMEMRREPEREHAALHSASLQALAQPI